MKKLLFWAFASVFLFLSISSGFAYPIYTGTTIPQFALDAYQKYSYLDLLGNANLFNNYGYLFAFAPTDFTFTSMNPSKQLVRYSTTEVITNSEAFLFTWNPAVPITGQTIDKYEISSTRETNTSTVITSVVTVAATVLQASGGWTTIPGHRPIHYSVCSINNIGIKSFPFQFTVSYDSDAPSPVTNFRLKYGGTTSSSHVDVAWSPSHDTFFAPNTIRYRGLVISDPGQVLTAIWTTTETAARVKLNPGKYRLAIFAFDALGQDSNSTVMADTLEVDSLNTFTATGLTIEATTAPLLSFDQIAPSIITTNGIVPRGADLYSTTETFQLSWQNTSEPWANFIQETWGYKQDLNNSANNQLFGSIAFPHNSFWATLNSDGFYNFRVSSNLRNGDLSSHSSPSQSIAYDRQPPEMSASMTAQDASFPLITNHNFVVRFAVTDEVSGVKNVTFNFKPLDGQASYQDVPVRITYTQGLASPNYAIATFALTWEGTFQWNASAYDRCGNSVQAFPNDNIITIDKTTPEVLIVPGYPLTSTPSFAIRVADSNSKLYGATITAGSLDATSGKYNLTTIEFLSIIPGTAVYQDTYRMKTVLPSGFYKFELEAMDLAGNHSFADTDQLPIGRQTLSVAVTDQWLNAASFINWSYLYGDGTTATDSSLIASLTMEIASRYSQTLSSADIAAQKIAVGNLEVLKQTGLQKIFWPTAKMTIVSKVGTADAVPFTFKYDAVNPTLKSYSIDPYGTPPTLTVTFQDDFSGIKGAVAAITSEGKSLQFLVSPVYPETIPPSGYAVTQVSTFELPADYFVPGKGYYLILAGSDQAGNSTGLLKSGYTAPPLVTYSLSLDNLAGTDIYVGDTVALNSHVTKIQSGNSTAVTDPTGLQWSVSENSDGSGTFSNPNDSFQTSFVPTAAGTVTINCIYADQIATKTFVVQPQPSKVKTITLSGPATMTINSTADIAATAFDQNDQMMSAPFTWSVTPALGMLGTSAADDPNQITKTFTASQVGDCTIQVTSGGITGTLPVTITPGSTVLGQDALSPTGPILLLVGESVAFTLAGKPYVFTGDQPGTYSYQPEPAKYPNAYTTIQVIDKSAVVTADKIPNLSPNQVYALKVDTHGIDWQFIRLGENLTLSSGTVLLQAPTAESAYQATFIIVTTSGKQISSSSPYYVSAGGPAITFTVDGKNALTQKYISRESVFSVTATDPNLVNQLAYKVYVNNQLAIDSLSAAQLAAVGPVLPQEVRTESIKMASITDQPETDHTVTVQISARDGADNDVSKTYSFQVAASARVDGPVLVAPNPALVVSQPDIVFTLTAAAPLKIYIYNETGRLVWQTTADGVMGQNKVKWDQAGVSRGAYLGYIVVDNKDKQKFESARY